MPKHEKINFTKYPKCQIPKFGMETTFAIDLPAPKGWQENEELWDVMLAVTADQFCQHNSLKHEWRENISTDPGCIEVATPPYENFQEYMKDYTSFAKEMKANGFTQSSCHYLYSEGMCHQNFDMVELKREMGSEKLKIFIKNMLCYVQQHPSICWSFLNPYDNHNAMIKGKTDGNWEALNATTYHVCYRFINMKDFDHYQASSAHPLYNSARMEMRFFMMPRNPLEMSCHYYFATQLINYIYQITMDGKEIEFDKNFPYSKYTFNKAFTEIQNVCREIGFDYKDMLKVGKKQILKERMSLGKKYYN